MAMTFACSSCGKCCNFSDHDLKIGVEDCISLAHDIPMSMELAFAPTDMLIESGVGVLKNIGSTASDAKLSAHVRYVIGSMYFHMPHTSPQVSVTASAIILPRKGGDCPALTANKCSVYAQRPYVCRTFPLSLDGVPIEKARQALANLPSSHYCVLDASAPELIDDNGDVSNDEYKEIEARQAGQRASHRRLAELVLREQSIHHFPSSVLQALNSRNTSIKCSLVPILQAAIKIGIIDNAAARSIVAAQVKLLNATDNEDTALIAGMLQDYTRHRGIF